MASWRPRHSVALPWCIADPVQSELTLLRLHLVRAGYLP